MSRAIFVRALVDLRWHVFWYGVGIAFYAALMIWLFPTFESFLGEVQYPEEFLEFFGAAGDLADPRYFLQAEYLSFAPVILMIYGIIVGTGMIAGDEGRGTLETLLAQPVPRMVVFMSRFAAIVVGLLAICAVNTLGWFVSVPFVDLDDLGLVTLVAASFAPIPLVLTYLGLAVLLSAVAPGRGSAAGILAALAIISYLLASFANTIEAIEWARWITPYFYADTDRLLTDGLVWWHQAVLLVTGGATALAGLVAFEGREIGAGRWQPEALAVGRRRLRGRSTG